MLKAACSRIRAAFDAADRADWLWPAWGLWAVLLVAGLVHVRYHGLTFPYADEWYLASVATGETSPTWSWLFEPINEHRVPVFKLAHTLLGEATNYDFRLMAAANTCVLAAAAAAYLFAIRRVRGWNAPVDLVVLGLLQHLGHQISLTSPVMLHCVSTGALILVGFVLVLAARQPLSPTMAAGLTLVLLLMIGNGAFGVVYAAALTCWLGLCGGIQMRDGERRFRGATILVCAAVAAGAISLVIGTTPFREADPLRSPSWSHTALGALRFMVTGLGPVGRALRPTIDYLVAALVVGGAAWVLLRGKLRSAGPTVWGVLLFLSAGVASAVVVSHSRAGGGLADLYQTRYAVYSAPLLCGVIAAWDLYAAAIWRRRLTAVLLTLLPAIILVNGRKGLDDSRERTAKMDAIAADLRAGVPTGIVAQEASAYLQWSATDVTRYFERMRMLAIGPYRGLEPLPPDPIMPPTSGRAPIMAADSGVLRR